MLAFFNRIPENLVKEDMTSLAILLILNNSTNKTKNVDSIIRELKERGEEGSKYLIKERINFLASNKLVKKDINFTTFDQGFLPEQTLILLEKGRDILRK